MATAVAVVLRQLFLKSVSLSLCHKYFTFAFFVLAVAFFVLAVAVGKQRNLGLALINACTQSSRLCTQKQNGVGVTLVWLWLGCGVWPLFISI
jgi:hypothetical protein